MASTYEKRKASRRNDILSTPSKRNVDDNHKLNFRTTNFSSHCQPLPITKCVFFGKVMQVTNFHFVRMISIILFLSWLKPLADITNIRRQNHGCEYYMTNFFERTCLRAICHDSKITCRVFICQKQRAIENLKNF